MPNLLDVLRVYVTVNGSTGVGVGSGKVVSDKIVGSNGKVVGGSKVVGGGKVVGDEVEGHAPTLHTPAKSERSLKYNC